MSIIEKIKSNQKIKDIILSLMIPKNEYRPRAWVKLFVNPLKHVRGRNSVIMRRTRLDVFPFNEFRLGEGAVIEDFSIINNGVGNVIIGDKTHIGMSNVIIGPVTIGNNVIFAQNIVVSGLNHGYEDITMPPQLQKTTSKLVTIGDDVWIGANAVITAGITLGKHCVIGAGSVVTKDIPDFSVAVGNPAKVIKMYNSVSAKWERVNGK